MKNIRLFIEMLFIIFSLLNTTHPLIAQDIYLEQLANCEEKVTAANPMIRSSMIGNCLDGVTAPDFEVITLEGDTIQSSQLRGKVMVINFWFTTCAPCVAEIPGLNEIVDQFEAQPVVFLAISPDDRATIQSFIEKQPFDFQMTAKTNHIFRSVFNLNEGFGYPTTIVLDKAGKIRKITIGGRIDDQATAAIKAELIPTIESCLK